MPLGDFTKARLEQRAADQWNVIIDGLHNLQELRDRAVAEDAAGALDTADFYQGKVTDKDNILGALNDGNDLAKYVFGRGLVAAPAIDPLRYASSLLGLG